MKYLMVVFIYYFVCNFLVYKWDNIRNVNLKFMRFKGDFVFVFLCFLIIMMFSNYVYVLIWWYCNMGKWKVDLEY